MTYAKGAREGSLRLSGDRTAKEIKWQQKLQCDTAAARSSVKVGWEKLRVVAAGWDNDVNGWKVVSRTKGLV